MNTQFNQTVWTVSKYSGNIEPMTMAEFLCEYYADETTSPAGVMPKLHVSESIRYELDDEGNEDWTAPYSVYLVNEWLPNGSKRVHAEFETEEQADEYILERWHMVFLQHSEPLCYDSEQECFEALAASRNLPRSVNMNKAA